MSLCAAKLGYKLTYSLKLPSHFASFEIVFIVPSHPSEMEWEDPLQYSGLNTVLFLGLYSPLGHESGMAGTFTHSLTQ